MNVANTILNFLAGAFVVLGLILLFSAKSLRPYLLNGIKAIWQKKYLWFLGIFAGLAAYGGEVNFLARKIFDISSFRDIIIAIRDAVAEGQTNEITTLLRNGFQSAPGLMISYALLILLIIALIYWLIIIAQGAVMRITGRMAMAQPTSFIDGISTSSGKFWEQVKVVIIFLLIGWGAWLVLAGLPTLIYFLTRSDPWTVVAQIGSYASLVVSFVNLFLIQYATAAVLLSDKRAVEAIVMAWNLFRRNTLITVELALVLFAANLVVLVLVASLLTFFFPLPTLPGFVTTLIILLIELGFMSAFSYSATVQLFVQLQKAAPESKLGQWTERIVNLATAKKPA